MPLDLARLVGRFLRPETIVWLQLVHRRFTVDFVKALFDDCFHAAFLVTYERDVIMSELVRLYNHLLHVAPSAVAQTVKVSNFPYYSYHYLPKGEYELRIIHRGVGRLNISVHGEPVCIKPAAYSANAKDSITGLPMVRDEDFTAEDLLNMEKTCMLVAEPTDTPGECVFANSLRTGSSMGLVCATFSIERSRYNVLYMEEPDAEEVTFVKFVYIIPKTRARPVSARRLWALTGSVEDRVVPDADL